MAAETTTVAAIIAAARRLTDTETASPTTDHVTDVELLAELNVANRKLVDLILSSGDAGIELIGPTSATLTSPWTVPSDLYRLVGVDLPSAQSPTQWIDVGQYHWRERNDRAGRYPRWRLQGRTLVFQQTYQGNTPTSARIWYIPQTVAATSGDSVPTYNGWQDFIVGALGVYIATKENMPTGVHKTRMDDAAKVIGEACRALVLAGTTTLGHVEAQPEDSFDYFRYDGDW